MTEREQFEATMKVLAEKPEESFETPYDNEDANTYWAIWQASRLAALEEAAQSVEALSDYREGDSYAHAIRALSQKESQ